MSRRPLSEVLATKVNMSEPGLSLAMVIAAQAVMLVLLSRVRWRCHEDGTCTSGCTEQSLVPSSDAIDCQEFVVGNDQRVLVVVSSKS